jgi:homogentisate 1,2-dioxygenase
MADYMSGFGNSFETEALPGALPQGQNSPQRCAYGLYAEQLSGSPFMAPREQNERSWLYRMRPSVRHTGRFKRIDMPFWKTAPNMDAHDRPIGQYRWKPLPIPQKPLNFITGMRTMTTAGDVNAQNGMAAHIFLVTRSMEDEYFYNADGELLIMPQQGRLRFFTEFGKIEVGAGEFCVIQRGVKFKVELLKGPARGYVCENYGGKFTLPNRGPIGANCLANQRDFKIPIAAFEEKDKPCKLLVKWGAKFFTTTLGHSPLDVVAWHGNYAPYKYDMHTFAPVNAVLFDHPDPSIFTVLTSPSEGGSTPNVDLIIFPERWSVAEHTFRPPWYHMNIMSEFMGLIYGVYEARGGNFVPGGISLHNCMLPHGPDAAAYKNATTAKLKPVRMKDTLTFMFETRFPQHVTEFAISAGALDEDYVDCWKGLKKKFNGKINP